jgi:acetylserotonin N-methyltransferase
VLWALWDHLDDAVREGTHRWKQTFGWDGPIFSHFFRDEDAKREFLMGMNGLGSISSPHVVAAFDLSRFQCLVDCGGATGHLAIAACRRYPALNAILFDLPNVVPFSRQFVAQSPVADRIRFMEGDFFRDPLPEGDLFALGRILHDWGEHRILELLGRIFERLPAGGSLLIAEKLLNDDKRGSVGPQMQDINMLLCTEGKERTLKEYESLLKKTGFTNVVGSRTDSPLDAILALK